MIAVDVMGIEVTLYALLGVPAVLIGCTCLEWVLRAKGCGKNTGFLSGLICSIIGLFCGRLLYCLLQADRLFNDAMGNFAGIGPFFDLTMGSVSVIGVLFGVYAGCCLASKLFRIDGGIIRDGAAAVGLFVFAFFRFIEPLSGQGYGPYVESEILARVPLSIYNWGGWSLSVCFMEGALLLGSAAVVLHLKWRVNGNVFIFAAILTALTQIVPESLRQDDALRIFVFARVNQLGFALIWMLCGFVLWRRGFLRRVGTSILMPEILISVFAILILVASEFALDKTDWPKLIIYGVMILCLAGTGTVLIRALRREDKSTCGCIMM